MPVTFNVGSRSLFVSLTAWVALVLVVLAAASLLLQHAQSPAAPSVWVLSGSLPLPGLEPLVVMYLPWLLGAAAVLSILTVACAVGLLLRLEWARRIFIGLLLLAMVATLGGLWLQQEVLQAVADRTLGSTRLPATAADVFGGFVTAARVMAGLVTLGASLLLGWVVRRLMSGPVRQEFA